MSFGINGPDSMPSIQPSHQTNDGGAGNLGYFRREKKKQEEDDKQENDSFELSSGKENGDEILMDELDNIGTKIKNFWLSINLLKKIKKNIDFCSLVPYPKKNL